MLRRTVAFGSALLTLTTFADRGHATGFTDVGEETHRREKIELKVDGYFRTRAELLHNLDLDRGLTPSGQPLFPVPIDDPKGQNLTYGDLRLRTDLALYAPGESLAVKARIDWLDDVSMGSAPASPAQSPGEPLRVKRAWGELRTPVGLLSFGRMGATWGLGMLANGGDCLDCDGGDAADRIAFATPILGHIFAIAYDFGHVSPTQLRQDGVRSLGVAPSTGPNTMTVAALRWHDPRSIVRRSKSGLATFDYGAYVSHQWQARDASTGNDTTSAQLIGRGLTATAADLWLRYASRWVHVELEAAYLRARVEDASLIPGVHYRQPVTSSQLGAALESEIAEPSGAYGVGLDAGYASGDSAPGFGAFPKVGAPAPKPGDLDGAQANPPSDRTVDNFRFHTDYRIDRILFREIIGRVTDAIYLRPHARVRLYESTSGTASASIAGIASWAADPASTPGLAQPLGVEVDPTLHYETRDGLVCALEYAVLFPLAGLDNPKQGLRAQPAQSIRARIVLRF